MINIEKAKQIGGPIYWEELDWLAAAAQDALVAIELGSLGGKSSRAIADNLQDFGVLYCIDTWKGSKNESNEQEYAAMMCGDHTYLDFLNATWDLVEVGTIIPLRMDGTNGAQFLKDKGIKADLIFLDGGHDQGETKADIETFLPLLNASGLICGHDYNSPAWIYVAGEVREVFGDNVKNPDKTTIWYI